MSTSDLKKLDLLRLFRISLERWFQGQHEPEGTAALRALINKHAKAAQQAVSNAGCLRVVALSPPPAIGGMAMPRANPFDMIFESYFGQSVIPLIVDMVDQAIGVYEDPERQVLLAEQRGGAAGRLSIFISHSSEDAELANRLIQLIRNSLSVPAAAIRCTSVDAYRLPGGAETDETIRREIMEVPVFIGLLSAASLRSTYVVFELGARWGAKKQLKPLLAPRIDPSLLRPPLSGLNALRCDNRAQLQQLVRECGETLDLVVGPADSYERDISEILALAAIPDHAEAASLEQESSREGDELIIRSHCEAEWGTDFRMRAHCEAEQRVALAQIRSRHPDDVPPEVMEKISADAAKEWPKDFCMRDYTEQQQIDAYRELRRSQK